MRFTDGLWRLREGVQLFKPEQVYEYSCDGKRLILRSPFQRVEHRGQTLQGPVFEIEISSPFENVIRIRFRHFKGVLEKPPYYEIYQDESFTPDIKETEGSFIFTSGKAKAIIRKNPFGVEFFYEDRFLTKSDLGYAVAPEGRFCLERLHLSVGEMIYGLGERFSAFVKNAQRVVMWNEDAGTISDMTYKNIPFYVSIRKYGVFVNDPGKVDFEIATEHVEKVQFSVKGETLDYFIIAGKDLKEVLERYTLLTGRPELPPAWSFGLWLTTSFTTQYDERTVMEFVDGMRERDIPLHVFHFDCFWMKEFHWVDLEWNRENFPDPEGLLKRLKEKGLKVCVWINPYVSQFSSLFDEGKEKGYFLKKPDGNVWQTDDWQPGMAIIDFTNPEARKWFASKLERLIDMGVDCFKTDFGERIPTDVVYYDGSDPEKMHNYYTYLYNKTVFETLERKLGKGNAVVFARSATAGSQKFPVHWGGDCLASYESMAETLRGGLSLALCGFGFWSHDIGGFEDITTPDLYKRWVAFGLLSSHSRLHGNSMYKVPWNFDEEAVEVLRFFTKLKCKLMPYIFASAVEAHEMGIPVMRPMILEFDDPTCLYLDRQYMLGESLLVAPIFSETGEVTYYLPEGVWTHFLTGERIEGGRWRTEKYDYFGLPLFVRPNSVIPAGSVDDRPDYDYADGVTLNVFEISNKTAHVYNTRDEVELSVKVERRENEIHVEVLKDSGKPWKLLFWNERLEAVEGAETRELEKGTEVVLSFQRAILKTR
ncbi:glycoside hydrolase family 31 [Thermotoga petrophila RKU-10]|uniref:alpha-D-xyloside xylohydrolase n=1 Tax=Thermotoga petrophila (strain ATCC BAA-489 / DSM 13996 / JCM 10882 / RKU-10) TaxID=590168 RepID=D2C7V0_THEP2|nr:alpha-xylosidase [Thermotoga petrophila]ADA67036.1 glycoside hydrolase family 31 [Thermotoga petrophila RKU-10]